MAMPSPPPSFKVARQAYRGKLKKAYGWLLLMATVASVIEVISPLEPFLGMVVMQLGGIFVPNMLAAQVRSTAPNKDEQAMMLEANLIFLACCMATVVLLFLLTRWPVPLIFA